MKNQTQTDTPLLLTDPDQAQRQATDTRSSVWVSASAGTGKTSVLTSRVLRLLLPKHDRPDDMTPPHKILCITYTKAAAAEMTQRVMDEAAKWVTLPDAQLSDRLTRLYGQTPTLIQFDCARRLFSSLIEAPGGLNFMTIHSFCESLLKRFPLEAGLSPHFDVLDDNQNQAILNLAVKKIIEAVALGTSSSAFHEAYAVFENAVSEKNFLKLVHAAFSNRQKLFLFFKKFDTSQKRQEALQNTLGLKEQDLSLHISDSIIENSETIINYLLQGSAQDLKKASALKIWLEDKDKRTKNILQAVKCFYKSDLLEQSQPTKTLIKKFPELVLLFQETGETLFKIYEQHLLLECMVSSSAIIDILYAIMTRYTAEKENNACLDFDDLIFKTQQLLAGNNRKTQDIISWVHYKLDGGIDHVLVDEAQDTNNAQWVIIGSLIKDFFDGAGRYDNDQRTVFVVGDYKQSIYSFQGADPQAFQAMQGQLSEQVRLSRKNWASVPLHISFRSTEPVLKLVDTVFQGTEGLALGLNPNNPLHHECSRKDAPGRVEYWPLIEHPKDEKSSSMGWQSPIGKTPYQNPEAKLAELIAGHIDGLIESKVANAGDILILVRRRNALVDHIIRALKRRNIPTSGADRMILQSHIAIEDLMTAAQFALQPNDDLSLACLLKSPFIGISEDDLYSLTCLKNKNSQSLWMSVTQTLPADTVDWLTSLIDLSGYSGLYDFFAHLLFKPAPLDLTGSGYLSILRRLGRDAIDPIEEFLNLCMASDLETGMSLEIFLHKFKHNPLKIKRELDKAGSVVRIMTVHAAKGLQAPIVYLPDCFGQLPHIHQPAILWPDQKDIHAPIVLPTKSENRTSVLDGFLEKETSATLEESLRLLYVALTRAQDRIIVCGVTPKKFNPHDNWHNLVTRAFHALEGTESFDSPTGKGMAFANASFLKMVSYNSHKNKDQITNKNNKPVPPWIREPIKEASHIAPVINPSRLDTDSDIVLSPLLKADKNRYARGLLIHRLLQFLPDIAPQIREVAAMNWLSTPGRVPMNINIDTPLLLKEVLDILNHTEFSDLFGESSRSEVPIVGKRKDGAIISGQVDRLVISKNHIKIIDFKTNRPAPMNLEDVPDQYIKQMKSYAELLRGLHPDKAISAALLWTDGPKLLPVPV